tara:strand:- start:2202 stop:2381 length:180 start_codon:yes stop_codon:yes gene_type:complete
MKMNKEYDELMSMSLTELVDYVILIKSKLEDATHLLNGCGFELVGGVWRDMEYYPDDMI